MQTCSIELIVWIIFFFSSQLFNYYRSIPNYGAIEEEDEGTDGIALSRLNHNNDEEDEKTIIKEGDDQFDEILQDVGSRDASFKKTR